MIIRNISSDDITEIKRLVERCGTFVIPYDIYAFWILGSYFYSTCRVAVENSVIVGYISGLPSIDRKAMFVWQLCVDIRHRNAGIGYRLIDEIIAAARHNGFARIEFSISEKNDASHSLSKKYAESNKLAMKELGREKVGEVNEILLCYEL